MKRAGVGQRAVAAHMKTGNFMERDEFTETKLPLHWTFMRTMREPWFDLTSKPGWLTINARPADIGKRTQPSFIGRRQQHAFATYRRAAIHTLADGEKAGLAAFQGDDNYYLLVLRQVDGRNVVQLLQSTPDRNTKVLACAPFSGEAIRLKIEARGEHYDFSYARPDQPWKILASDVDGTFLSTKIAGGFVGAMLGMYAYSPR